MAAKKASPGSKAQKSAEAPREKKPAAQTSKSKGQAHAGPGKIAQLKQFFEESKVELKKVTWPSRKETIATSVAVLVLVFVMSIYLWLVDLGFSQAIQAILS